MRKWMFAAGVAVGYVLGARAGRERYEQIAATARKIRDNQTVRDTTDMLSYQAGQVAGNCRQRFMDSSIGVRLFGERHDAVPPGSPRWPHGDVPTSHGDRVQGF